MNRRYGSTEALRVGSWEHGNAGVNSFGLVHAGSDRNKVPANAVVKLGLQHGGGGMYSHVACTIDGVNAESRGNPGGVIYGSVVRGGQTYYARAWNDRLFHDFWYLPGPIVGELDPNAFPLPTGFYYGWYSGPEQSISGKAGESKAWIDGLARAQAKLGVPVSRVYDAATNKAVSDFQRANGFALVDGFLGAKTWPLLFAAKKDEVDLDMTEKELEALIFRCLKTFVGPIGADVKDVREQITGGRDGGQYPGHKQGGGRTLYDLAAATANKSGVPNTSDTLEGR
ncbi:peptidoglycan-binding domain-containing protein [Rhodococcus sp. 06-156-3C]|uniref:peptidoglycan-binding domain-containing protein n=1 Tax=Rhodococcus sp. 06-156-3C TaxID=2022486 RepID=UPI001595BC97|nr:peptidoglycan-binding protein [Rhodococcus sp. 06-156-3C]